MGDACMVELMVGRLVGWFGWLGGCMYGELIGWVCCWCGELFVGCLVG